jgi:hypothetical protein
MIAPGLYRTFSDGLIIVACVVWFFGLYQKFAFSRELKAALQSGAIPPQLLRPRMGFLWLLRNASVMPTGPYRRTLIVASWIIWGICVLGFGIMVLGFGPPHPLPHR